MNIANKLTILRIVMVPLFVVFMLAENIPLHYLWALLTFMLAGFTDYLDGQLARKHNLITEFGKFLDPLADKVLTMSALICFVELGWTGGWMVIVILAREFLMSGIRLVAVGRKEKIVIAADILGKVKTASTMIVIIIILILQIILQAGETNINILNSISTENTALISNILMLIVTLLTVISGVSYIYKNRKIFKEEE